MVRGDKKKLLGLALENVGRESLVFLFVDELVLAPFRAELMTKDAMGAEGLGILSRIEDGPVVVGPGEIAGDIGDHVFQDLAAVELLESNLVDSPTLGVDGISEEVLVGADPGELQCEKRLSLRQLVAVNQDLFRGCEGLPLATMDGVLTACLEARVVEVIVAPVRNRLIVGLQPSFYLLEDLFL